MLSVLLIWLYIAVTAGIVGRAVLAVFRCRPRRAVSYWLAGLVGVTVYAEAWSLFGGVGAAANAVLLAGCAALALVFCRKGGWLFAGRQAAASWKKHPLQTLTGAAAVLLLAAGTSAGTWHADTPLYHAQAIHWIEAYGVIPGLGNLQSHFAYNNACFSLYALYSFSWLGGQSFHAVQGFLAVLLALLCLPLAELAGRGRRRGFQTADALRLAAIFQLALLFDELVSPSSDCFILLLVHIVFLLWAELTEVGRREASPVPYALIAMLAVYAATVKLAAAPLLLLAGKPVAMLLRGRAGNLRTLGKFILTAALIVLPFFARGFFLSGWVLYPVLPEHLAEAPWRMPDGVGRFESFEIRENGRMIFDMSEADTSLFGWEGAWFVRQPRAARFLIGAAFSAGILALARTAACGVFRLLRGKAAGRRGSPAGRPLFEGGDSYAEMVLVASTLFWFFTTPQVRFGEGYLLILTASVWGGLLCALIARLPERRRRAADGVVCFLARLLAAGMAVWLFAAGKADFSSPLRQQDYDRYPVAEYQIGGISFYYPTEYVYTGYYAFPATRWQVTDVYALGTKITDGFAAEE